MEFLMVIGQWRKISHSLLSLAAASLHNCWQTPLMNVFCFYMLRSRTITIIYSFSFTCDNYFVFYFSYLYSFLSPPLIDMLYPTPPFLSSNSPTTSLHLLT